MAKFKIDYRTSMADVLTEAAEKLEGRPLVRELVSRNGGRSLYGEAFHMIGITDEDICCALPCLDLLLLPGATEWDEEHRKEALHIARDTWGRLTVGKVRNFLRSQGASPETLK